VTDESRPQPDLVPEGQGTTQAPPIQAPAPGGPPEIELPSNLAILPSRDAVLYPGMLLPLQVSDPQAVRLLSEAVSARQPIGLSLQLDPQSELSKVGTVANIVRLLKLPDGSLQVLLQGAARIGLGELTQREPYIRADIQLLHEPQAGPSMETEGLIRNLQTLFQRLVQLSPILPDEMAIAASNLDEPGRLADFVAANCDLEPAQRQEVLEEIDPLARARRVTELATREIEVLEIGSRIQSQIRETMDKSQREFYLRQQLDAIRKELGEGDESEAALAGLRQRLQQAGLPEEARKEADRELNRLASIPTASPEHSMVRTYLEWLADLPWSIATEDNLDLAHAKRVLDEDHHDLDRVKDRILEYLAVMKLRSEQDNDPAAKLRGPILCLVGPPGVGKTSLGQSIARALGRKFVRMSLGGVRDEAEIRGHRRTYIGALPGRIIQGLRRAGSRNPVFILDELDKLGNDWRGDPSSALLEVLDPAQNSDFRDHYLDVPFDLSTVLFIATANVLDTVPPALRDRLEVIDLPGYAEEDKLQIARRFLVPRQLSENGLSPEQVSFSTGALRRIIREYTREAGVRNLEREIATIARKAARALVTGDATAVNVSARKVQEMLGPPRFLSEVAERGDEVGVATGLAYTPTGGEVLFVEARIVPGKGELILTGQLGDVMKESAQAALTYARSRSQALGLGEADPFAERDVHVHVPAGAVSKDGPSAGITMATAIISALTRRPVDHCVGMTGEITLRGRVLPIGGLKEKVLAAHRAGLDRIIAPRENRKDLEEIPARARKQITFTWVDHMDQVLNIALKREVRAERAEVKAVRVRRSRDKVAAHGVGL
jgi:ATP-dependent Lon protease